MQQNNAPNHTATSTNVSHAERPRHSRFFKEAFSEKRTGRTVPVLPYPKKRNGSAEARMLPLGAETKEQASEAKGSKSLRVRLGALA